MAQSRPLEPLDVTDLAPPSFDVFSGKDGLTDEIWSTVGFDANGLVWAGSASSLAWFDGYTWHSAEAEGARSLVRDMVTTPDGMLWAIFEREGLARYDGTAWSLDGTPGFKHRFSSWTRPNGDREVWVARDGGIARWTPNGWKSDTGTVPGPPGRTIKIMRTESLFGAPREWLVRTPGQVFWRLAGQRDTDWTRFDVPDVSEALKQALFTDLLRTHDAGREELWMTTYGSGLLRIDADGARVWRDHQGELPSEAVYSALATHDDKGRRTLWLATRSGLVQMHDGQIRVFDRADGLPSNAIRGIKLQRVADADPVLWLATEGGLVRARLEPSPWRTVSRLGSRVNGVFGVLLDAALDGSQRVWFGSARDGLVRLDERGSRHWPASTAGGALRGITSLINLPDPAGGPPRTLVSTDSADLYEIAGGSFRVWSSPFSDLGTPVTGARTLGSGPDQETWFGTRGGGLWRMQGETWTRMSEPTTSFWGMDVQAGADGRIWLWAGGSTGIVRWDGQRLTHVDVSIDAAEGGYRDVELINHLGRMELWAASLRNGVIRFDVSDPSDPRRIDDDAVPPPPDPTVYSVLEDSVGRIYVCTNNGVQLLMPTSSGRFAERVYRRSDGLVHDECNTGAQAIDAFDRYWVGTLAGLSLFDPALGVRVGAVRRYPLILIAAFADRARVADRGSDSIRVPAGTRELEVDFVQLTNQRESETRYRSQLIGYESSPQAWTAAPGRRFGQLPPGDYRLQIEARDFADVEAEPVTVSLSVEPLWWQRTGVRLAAAVGSLLILLLSVMTYNRNLRRRRDQLQLQVEKRTAELNTLNTRLTELSYRDPLTGLANRRSLTIDAYDLLEDGARRGQPVGLALVDIDGFKQYNDRHGHLAGDSALQVVAQLLREGVRNGDGVGRFGGEEFVCLLPGADGETTRRIADSLRAAVETRTPDALETEGVTISIGTMSTVPKSGDDLASLLNRADQALYAAKHAGRNRVRAADPGPGADRN